MDQGKIAIIVSIVAFFGGVVPAILMYVKDASRNRSQNKKDDAEHDKIIADAAMALVAPLQKRITELEARLGNQDIVIQDQEKRIKLLESELGTWQDGANRLILQLKSHSIKPVWEPCKEG